jgi:hypothetical protein
MQTLHDEDDAAGLFIIKSAIKCVIVPGINCIALGLRQRFIGFQRVINDDEVRTSAS